MKTQSFNLSVQSRGHTDVIDITPKIQKILSECKLKEGTATLFVTGSTAGLTTIEYEPGLVKDIKAAFQRIAPDHIDYAHHARWGDNNGHSHVRASILGSSLVIPFVKGTLTLGTWQQIILVDFDTRERERNLVVQIMGE
jgi:secondary thiamine-phosphate synthase enzyme